MSRPQALRAEFEDVKTGIEKIERAAADASRDLTDDEQADIDKLFARAEQLKPDIQKEADRHTELATVSDILARVNPNPDVRRSTPAVRGQENMNAGEYLSAFIRAHHPDGDMTPAEFIDRASGHFDRAVSEQNVADTAAIVPTPIIGALLKIHDARRPVFASFSQQPMPGGSKTFERPKVTQQVAVAEQAAEYDELTSQEMNLATTTVTKRVFGGTLNLSRQNIDWTSGAALQLVVQDFADVYASIVEGEACDALEAVPVAADAASNGDGYSAWTATNVETIVGSYIDGIIDVYGRGKVMPDTAWLDLASWGVLAKTMTGQDDRTALDVLREALREFGADGFRFVVGPQLAANTRILGYGRWMEAYEQQHGLLRVEQPSTWSVNVATAGYVAFYNVAHEGFVLLGTDPTP